MSFDRRRALAIARDPLAAAREAKERTGRPVVATVSSWAPDPIILASGAVPLRLPAMDRAEQGGGRARAHLQASSCFLCQGILDAGLSGRLDFVDALLFVQTCDAQQNLSDILKLAVDRIPVLDAYMPVNRSSGAAAAYLESELWKLCRGLGEVTGSVPDEDSLAEALVARQAVENALADLYDARLDADGRVPATDHYATCIASACLPPEEAEPLVRSFVDAIRQGGVPRECPRERSCMLLGSVLPFPGLYELLDSLEVAVRDDDLSLGRRLFDHPLPSGGTALERVARSMLERSPGATKYHDNLQRGVAQARAARRAGLRHAVMCVLKFCDPWAWDYPAVRDTLEEAGVGTLLVELAGGEDLSGGPVRNRVEAYFEMDGMGDLFDG
jgi:benzoyl-CoA reductase subunit C